MCLHGKNWLSETFGISVAHIGQIFTALESKLFWLHLKELVVN
jgi:hypothetical protein